jgi:hypothetical protein
VNFRNGAADLTLERASWGVYHPVNGNMVPREYRPYLQRFRRRDDEGADERGEVGVDPLEPHLG